MDRQDKKGLNTNTRELSSKRPIREGLGQYWTLDRTQMRQVCDRTGRFTCLHDRAWLGFKDRYEDSNILNTRSMVLELKDSSEVCYSDALHVRGFSAGCHT
jgi:hypothetical protein